MILRKSMACEDLNDLTSYFSSRLATLLGEETGQGDHYFDRKGQDYPLITGSVRLWAAFSDIHKDESYVSRYVCGALDFEKCIY